MNSVIEKLAEQAAESVVAFEHDVVLRVEHEEGATLEVPADFIFEFAKLIARECAEVVKGVPVVGPGSKGCDEIIKEHFGIDQDGS